MKYSELTQKIVNRYPSWSRIRTNKASVGQQFINAIALSLEDVYRYSLELPFVRFPQLTNLNSISGLYYVQLPSTFSFNKDATDPYHPRYLPPTVVGYYSTLSGENVVNCDKYEDFINAHLNPPNRLIRLSTLDYKATTLLDVTCTNTVNEYTTFNDMNVAGRVKILISGASELINTETGNAASIIIYGIKRNDTEDIYNQVEIYECIDIPFNAVYQTMFEYKKITKVIIRGVSVGTKLRIVDMYGNIKSNSIFDPKKLYTQEAYIKQERTVKRPVVLLRDKTDNSDLIIQNDISLLSSAIKDPIIHVAYVRQDTIYDLDFEYETLYEIELNGIHDVIDYDIQPFTDNLFLLCDGGKTIKVVNISRDFNFLSKYAILKTSPYVSLNVDKDDVSDDTNIRIDLSNPHPLAGFISFSLTVEYPDGTRYTIQKDGTLVSYDETYTISSVYAKDPIFINFEKYNTQTCALLKLTSFYKNGYSDFDYVPLTINVKSVLKKYSLNGFTAKALYFGAGQFLYLLDEATDKLYQYDFIYDIMYVDYDNKLIVFRDNYDEVEIT